MKFSDIVRQAVVLLRDSGRVTYRTLKREFDLEDDSLADLKDELLYSHAQHVREEGPGLVWTGTDVEGEKAKRGKGEVEVVSSQLSVLSPRPPTPNPQHLSSGLRTSDPGRRTPLHLAERIHAVNITDGERKTITALFADLKGSTALIEGLDPEEARAIIDPALQLMMDAVHQYDGYVAQALGDGIFALFGAPTAHEDHPQRALYAALRMQEEMRHYADTLRTKGYPPLLMRVGINTGEVVVRSIRKDEQHADYVPVGHSTNLAARMEQLAAPGTILVTEQTYKLAEGYFSFKGLGKTPIKGVEEPLQVYEVLGVGPLRTRLQASARRGLTRFVGRQREMEQLERALAQAKIGHGQIVGVMGEPGLGKSRLFHEFVEVNGDPPVLKLHAFSVSHGNLSPYLPLIELLKSYFDISAGDDERKRREKVGGKVLMLDRSLEDTLLYLFALLSIEEQPSPLRQMDPQIRRRRTCDALKRLFLRESLKQPVILLLEDLHWIDSATQEVIDALSEGVASAKILLLVNYRPEYRHEWGSKTYYTQLRMTPFGTAEAEEFLDVLLSAFVGAAPRVGSQESGAPTDAPLQVLKQLILEKTEGTPFFMEEIVQELVEQGVLVRDGGGGGFKPVPTMQSSPDLHIPTTVQGVLASRIDRLVPDEKTLLQQLAVIGRAFSLRLVRHVVQQREGDLDRLLSSLQHKEFLYEHPAFPDVEYVFKHVLTQEVAYHSVLIERRKMLHEHTAQAIEQLYHDRIEEHYSELAHHYSRSGNTEKAIAYLQQAGQQAAQNSAHMEAASHFTMALDLLKSVPETPERVQRELPLLLTLAASLQVTKGPSAPEVGDAYMRAQTLCEQGGDEQQHFAVLRGVWLLHHVQADLTAARETGEQLLAMAERIQDSALLLEARRTLGSTLLWQGEFPLARVHLEQAVTLYDQQQHETLKFLYGGADPGIVCLCELARVLLFLGYPDQALLRSQAAVTLARTRSDPFSLGFALIFAAGLHQLRREAQATQSYSEDGIALAREHGFAALLSAGTIRRGWAFAEQGQEEEGLRHMQQGLTARQETGAELAQPYFLALQAEVYGKLGQEEHALTLISDALTAMYASGEHRLEAELYRIKGELTLQKSGVRRPASEVTNSPRSKVQGPKSKIEDSLASDVRRSKSESPSSQHLAPSTQAEAAAEACFLQAIEIARQQHAKSLELRATVSLARLWKEQALEQGEKSQESGVKSQEQEARIRLAEAHRVLSDCYNWFTEGFETKDLQEAKTLIESLSHRAIELLKD